jgi:hypothetical protein
MTPWKNSKKNQGGVLLSHPHKSTLLDYIKSLFYVPNLRSMLAILAAKIDERTFVELSNPGKLS